MNIEEYFSSLDNNVVSLYNIAKNARVKGLDPSTKVEVDLARSMPEKCAHLVSTLYPSLPVDRVVERMTELEEQYGQLNSMVVFTISREIAEGKFCSFESRLAGIDCGLRLGFAYLTLGVVSSPIEGFSGVYEVSRNDSGTYLRVDFSGPVRSAGSTAVCVFLILVDYLRKHFGYSTYDPSDNEINRYVVECRDYHEEVTNLQYFPSEEEIRFLVSHLPIEIGGTVSHSIEVSSHKDLDRVGSPFIRGGMCLVLCEGLAQKGVKAFGRVRNVLDYGISLDGFLFLEQYASIHSRNIANTEDSSAHYIRDLVAGRPVYSHPSRSGGFRFRYGRGRSSGFSSVSIHPATMGVSGGFLSHGTQLKIEQPSKGCVITSCDSIDGPIVRMKNGSVRSFDSYESAVSAWSDIEEIIYLGDLLFPLGDVIDRNVPLLPSAYVEEWWYLELESKMKVVVEELPEDFNYYSIDLATAMSYSDRYSIPLHPRYIFYWKEIDVSAFWWLLDWLSNGVWRGTDHGKLVLPWQNSVRSKFSDAKRALEILGVVHEVVLDNIVIEEEVAHSLLVNLGIPFIHDGERLRDGISSLISQRNDLDSDVLAIVNGFSHYVIRDKSGTFIGARMGRPEKAKLRELTGNPHVLFPFGNLGGKGKLLSHALESDQIKGEFRKYICRSCNNSEGISRVCLSCGNETIPMFFCSSCNRDRDTPCSTHKCSDYSYITSFSLHDYYSLVLSRMGLDNFSLPVHGVSRMLNNNGSCEYLGKGLLRSKYNLSVNKDGTIRYDATELCLTHFKPIEIQSSVEQLRELGYVEDIYGNPLERDDQILQLFPHDVVLPSCPSRFAQRSDDVLFNISHFLDEELVKVYGLDPFYRVLSRDDLLGQLVVLMSPHNCAGVVGRIIGFSSAQGVYTTPFMHAAMRRDCDGDECSVMMLLDVLLNFSRSFLPLHRGGTQDSPLVINSRINPGEVDDQVLSFEMNGMYPLSLYESSLHSEHSSNIDIDTVGSRLKNEQDPFAQYLFTHDSFNINSGETYGAYKSLSSMKEKVDAQMELVRKIRAVDTDDIARLIIERHFLRDIRSNLIRFSRQRFRCVSCGNTYRRVPLSGNCHSCGHELQFTVSEGSIRKYIDPALLLSKEYRVGSRVTEELALVCSYVDSVFGVSSDTQMELGFEDVYSGKQKSSSYESNYESGEQNVLENNQLEKNDLDNNLSNYNDSILDTDSHSESYSEKPSIVSSLLETSINEKNVDEPKDEQVLGNDLNNSTTLEVVNDSDVTMLDSKKTQSEFVHLHLHTEFSFLDGGVKVRDLFNRVKELGMDSVAITEHGNMESMVRKYNEAKKAGVKLIFGCEPYIVSDMLGRDKSDKRYHLLLLAKDIVGFKNLIRLVSLGNTKGFYYKPRIDKATLRKYSEGLICTSACVANDIAQAVINEDMNLARELIEEYIDIFGKDNFYLEIQNHHIPEEALLRKVYPQLAEEYGLQIVATNDVHYLLKEDSIMHEAMLCIQTNGSMNDPNHFKFDGSGFHISSVFEMKELFSEFPNALSTSVEIANRCNVELDMGTTIFPDFIAPDGLSHEEYMKKLCLYSLDEKYKDSDLYDKAKERLEYELGVITKMGFETYFLIVADFISYAKHHCQVGPGRGSGAGSIVAYLLGITQLEPLSLGLLFERFLNPERISLPDFDVDFGDRDIVIEYVKQKYGDEKIALIGTYGTMSAKSVLKDVMRVFSIPFSEANEITNHVVEKTIEKSLDARKENNEFTDDALALQKFRIKYPQVFEIAMKLEGTVRHKGVHACGVVWGKENITEYFPVGLKDGFYVAQAEGPEIEEFGLVKFDFLGLETLNITKKILDMIGKDAEWLESLPLDDDNVYDILRKGESVGVFQLESEGMKKTLRSVLPTSFDDIIAIVSLYRPGPMQYLEVYADRKAGREQAVYPHPWAEEILGPTYGIMVYQEQVMQLAQKLAGFTMGKADVLRKAIGKKKLDLMQQVEGEFKEGCRSVASMKDEQINQLWDDIVKFASYSFNKSHAAAYALISYRTAYLRRYYPAEFIAATISSSVGNPEKVTFYLEEARRMGIKILGPDINSSDIEFSVEELSGEKVIRFGLNGIKNVGESALDSIIRSRPYASYQEFIDKVDLSKVNKRVLKHLISVGCFDSLGDHRGQLLATYEHVKKQNGSGTQLTLFSNSSSSHSRGVVARDLTLREKLTLEQEIMGVCVSGSLFDLFLESTYAELDKYSDLRDGEEFQLFGIVNSYRKIVTKKGDDMAFLSLVGKGGECDCVIFPSTFAEFRHVLSLREGDGVIVSGRYNEDSSRGNSLVIGSIKRATEVS